MTSNHLHHFETRDTVNFELSDGSEFVYKPTTAGDENDWLDEYIEPVVKDGKVAGFKQNASKLNKCKLRNLVSTPYGEEEVSAVLGKKASWKDLDKDERWQMLRALRPKFFDEIMKAINKADNPKGDDIKK